MGWRKWAVGGLAMVACLPSWAEDITGAAVPAASESKFVGGIDLRPSVKTKFGTNHSEDTLEFGYQWAKNRIFTVVQYFETNLKNSDPGAEPFTLYDTFLRTRINKIAELADGLSFSYQSRIYLPASQGSKDRGMIATFRNYLTLSQKVNDVVTLTLSDLPILPVYTGGGVGSGETASANAYFENRVYLIGDFQITSKLSLSVPIMFHQTRYSNFSEGAKNNNAWTYFLWTYPEITYELTGNTSVGLAYYSSNLVKSDLSELTLGDGLEDGVLQLVFAATL